MARKRTKKKTLSQDIVNFATSGMPQPVRKLVGGRWTAALIVLSIPLLLVTGLMTVTWENGRPHLLLNRQKAAEVKQHLSDDVQALRAEHAGNRR
jgi:hypothetical protein